MINSVINRIGVRECFDKTKIFDRLFMLAPDMEDMIIVICNKINIYLYDNIGTRDIDELTAWLCEHLSLTDTRYLKLMAMILYDNMRKDINLKLNHNCQSREDKIVHLTKSLYVNRQVSSIYKDFIMNNSGLLSILNTSTNIKGSSYDIIKKYSRKINGVAMELPEDLFMRCAIVTCGYSTDNVVDMYDALSKQMIIYGTPTLVNGGTLREQLASCFLLDVSDNVYSQIDFIADCAKIIANFGGIGSSIHKIRAVGSKISTGTGKSTGIIKLIKTLKCISEEFNQQIRSGSHAIYIMPSHPEIFEFLDNFTISKNSGKRCLFPAMWLPDEFMRCVKYNKPWGLVNPMKCGELEDLYDAEFTTEWIDNPDPIMHAYTYKYRQCIDSEVNARELYMKILKHILTDGVPYMLSKDSVNRTNNHNYLGPIRSSNLCTEIVQYKDENNIAVCNIASVILPNNMTDNKIDECKIKQSLYMVVTGLNNVINVNNYPSDKCKEINYNERPIGIGIQGLAEVFAIYGYDYESTDALELSAYVAELIYYYALYASYKIAKKTAPFKGFNHSYLGSGIFNWELYNMQNYSHKASPKLDWELLRKKIAKHGVANSLLIAYMPTSTTSSLSGVTPCFEPFNGMIYKKSTSNGERTLINDLLMNDLRKAGIYNKELHDEIVNGDIGISHIGRIPEYIRNKYKCIFEVDPKYIVLHNIYRSPYIDQASSMNLFIKHPKTSILSECIFDGWKGGLKSLSYYTRIKPPVGVQRIYGSCTSCGSA